MGRRVESVSESVESVGESLSMTGRRNGVKRDMRYVQPEGLEALFVCLFVF